MTREKLTNLATIAVAAALTLLVGAYCAGRASGAADVTDRARADSLRLEARYRAQLARDSARWLAQRTRDTVYLTRTRRTTDTVLARLTDTLVHVDTVRVLVAEERRACDAALFSCSAQLATANEQAASYARSAALWQARAEARRCTLVFSLPCPSRRVVALVGVGVGFAGGVALSR